MNREGNIDRTDSAILDLLQRDCSLSSAAIAETLHLSQSPCWRRINRLQEQGYIRGRVALLDRDRLGMDVVVFATVNLTATGRQNLLSFEAEIVRYEEVLECYTMAGIWDYLLKIVTRDIRHYEQFVRETLSANPAVRELHSHMAVTEIKNSTALPIATQG